MIVFLSGLVKDHSYNGTFGEIIGKSANGDRVLVLAQNGIVYAVRSINVREDPFSFFS
jgi:hypothetical protein